MPSREVVYRVQLDTAAARREATGFRRQIERDLSIDVGSTSGGTKQAAAETTSFNKALTGLNKTLGIFGLALGAQQLYNWTVGLASLGTEAARAQIAFNNLAGGAAQAAANVRSIQSASGGTVSSLDAIKIGNQAAALSLAKTAEEFGNVTRAGRIVALISPVIHDISSAISELGLASANLSFRRLDQLGLSVQEVREGMADLRAENASLSESQAFLQASMAALERKGGDILDSTEAQATGFEKLAVAIAEARRAMGEGWLGQSTQAIAGFLANSLNELNVLFAGATAETSVIEASLDSITTAYKNQSNILENTPWLGDILKKDRQQIVGQMQEVKQILSLATDALGDDPALLQYQQGIQEIAASVVRWGYVTEEQIGTLRELYDELERQKDLNAPQVAADAAAEAARKTEEERQANITDQGTQIKGSLQQQAIGVASTVGIEEALSALKEQKALVDSAIDELIKSGVSDPDEIALRLAGLNDQIVQFFDNIKAEATDFSFDGIDQAFANIFTDLNFGDIDFLPGLEQLRDDAISLFEEIQQAGGTVTEEQAAMLDYYSAAASAAADESSALGGIVNELGSEFIANNELVGELISQMYLTQAAFGAGQIGADTFAGRMAALGGQLLAYITQAGVATDATYALINAQAGLKGTAGYTLGFGTGNAIGAGIKAREESRQREQARREAEQAAKAAAREQERAAKAAARELEQGAKKAAQELQSALKGVPGLFGRSAITQKDFDLTKAGVYQDQADEKLRRLQAEVEQGKDLFSDISIEDAKQSLRDLGVQVAEDNKVAFEQFADAWESGLLFFDADNIAKYIDAEAVQRSLDLQAKAKEGQENIFKAFGATVDDAVAAVGTGLTSAGAVASPSGGYTIPIKAELTPMTPTEAQTIPTLGGISPVIDIAAIQGQLAETPFEIQITLGADGVSNFANEFMAQLGNTDKFIGIGDSIKAAIAQEIGTTKFTDAGIMTPIADGLIRAINTEFSIKSKNIGAQGNSVGENLKASIASNLGTTEWKDGQAVTPIANGLLASIGTQIRASGDKIKGIAAGFSDSLKGEIASAIGTTQWQDGEILAPIANGLLASINTQIRGSGDQLSSLGGNVANTLTGSVANGLAAQEDAVIATAMVSALNSQFTTAQNMFYAVGQIPAQNILGGYVGFFSTGYSEGSGTPLVTPMVTAINTQIRANTEALRGQGATMASYVINGFAGSFSNETFKNTIIAAGELMGSYLEIGILSRIRGGALVEAIGAQVLADIADTVEEPTP